MNNQVIEEIKQLCGKVMMLDNGWYHFMYRRVNYLYIPDNTHTIIRISIPHVINSSEYTKGIVSKAINETNREVKFIKAVILKNGSISLNYDYKICDDDKITTIIPHMIMTLHFASEYIKIKLSRVTSDLIPT